MTITIDQIVQKMDNLPEPPRASVLAVNMLEDPQVPIVKVAEFISQDECLTTKLLRLGNSAYYGFSGKISTVKEALMRIGTNIVKCSLYSSMLETAGFQPSFFFLELWKSSLFTAYVAKDIAERLGHPRLDLCFTAGLLCDVGQLMLNEFAPEVYQNLIAKTRQSNYDVIQAEYQVFGFTHVQVGYKMADAWKLPVIYQNVIKFHHNPLQTYGKVMPDDYKLIVAVHLANQLSPLFGNQKGAHIQQDALGHMGLNMTSEGLVNILSKRFPSYYQEIAQITHAMFSDT
jgi:putative nucleotidyltransferase with HDIG domain